MSLLAHLGTLEEKHAILEAAIVEESARPLPDFTTITQLKKQKLHLKEEVERFARATEKKRQSTA